MISNYLSEVSKLSNKNTIVIFNFHAPTIASCLMWMFDVYTLLSLINIDYLKLLLKKIILKLFFLKDYYSILESIIIILF